MTVPVRWSARRPAAAIAALASLPPVVGAGSPAAAQQLDFGDRDLFARYRVRVENATPRGLVERRVEEARLTAVHKTFFKQFRRLPRAGEPLPPGVVEAGGRAAQDARDLFGRKAEGEILLAVYNGNVLYDLADPDAPAGFDPLGQWRVICFRDSGEIVVKAKRENRYRIQDGLPGAVLGPMPLLPFPIGERSIGKDFVRQPDGSYAGRLACFGFSSTPDSIFTDARVTGRRIGDRLFATKVRFSRLGVTYCDYRVDAFRHVNGVPVPTRVRRTHYQAVSDTRSVPGRTYTLELIEAGPRMDFAPLFDWRGGIKGRTIVERVGKTTAVSD